jgi:predicted nuclease with TOPRIM domain
MAWIKLHPRLSVTILMLLITAAYGGISWTARVTNTVYEEYPQTCQEVKEILISNARLETEGDNYQERISALEKNQAEILQALPRIDANIEWIREWLENEN